MKEKNGIELKKKDTIAKIWWRTLCALSLKYDVVNATPLKCAYVILKVITVSIWLQIGVEGRERRPLLYRHCVEPTPPPEDCSQFDFVVTLGADTKDLNQLHSCLPISVKTPTSEGWRLVHRSLILHPIKLELFQQDLVQVLKFNYYRKKIAHKQFFK